MYDRMAANPGFYPDIASKKRRGANLRRPVNARRKPPNLPHLALPLSDHLHREILTWRPSAAAAHQCETPGAGTAQEASRMAS
jgi:hypothetical protein